MDGKGKVLTIAGEAIRPGMVWTDFHVRAVSLLLDQKRQQDAEIASLGTDYYRLRARQKMGS